MAPSTAKKSFPFHLPDLRRSALIAGMLLGCASPGLLAAASTRTGLPPGAVELAQNWLRADPKLAQAAPMVFADGWRVYHLERLSDVLRGEFLRATQPFGWCLPAWDGANLQGLVQLSESPGAGLRVSGYLTPLSPEFAAALAAARKQAADTPGATDLRELRAPDYRLRAFWLHSADGDWFFPTADGEGPGRPWRTGRACSAAELAGWLKPLAEELIRTQFGTR